MNTKYKVSTIIPVYNCENYISRAVESVIGQPDFSDIELILIDDGSTDNTNILCDGYAEKYENIIVIHQKNAGVSAARNSGLAVAKGEWISFLDSDDYLLDGFYTQILSARKADLLCCNYISSNGNKSACLPEMYNYSHAEKYEFNTTLYMTMISLTSFFPCWNKLYKNDIIKNNKIRFADGVKLGEDMMFVFDYVKHIESYTYIEKPLYYYYVYNGNTTSVIKKGFETYYEQYKWQCKYIQSLDCDKEVLLKQAGSTFVYRSVLAINSAGSELGLSEGIGYIKMIINNDTFFSLYVQENYQVYKCRYDKYLFGFIKEKSAARIFFLIKIYKIISKISLGKR